MATTLDIAVGAPDKALALPTVRTSFVGRDRELDDIDRLLGRTDAQLVTIVGRSGVGKTRLALEAGRRRHVSWQGGAAFIELGRTDDAGMIPVFVAAALGTLVAPGATAEDAIRARLRRAPTLLVIDEIDRVPGAADVLLDLMSTSPASRILATGQRPLHHASETVVRLAPLAVPDADGSGQDPLAASAAVTLFAERAAAVDPGFDLARTDARAVAELCRRLDGLPLAIELAATRARIMPPVAQLAALDAHSSLELRSSRGADRPERHRDLRSAIAVSHDLAGASERIVLRRMSVFATDATSTMLEAVAAEPGWTLADILDALVELVDLGLVEVDPGDDEPCYRLLPTVGDFAYEQLEKAGEVGTVERRHAAAFFAAARRTRMLAEDPQLRALERDAADLHRVFSRAVAGSRLADALELAADLAPLWHRRGLFAGPRTAFEEVLDAIDTQPSGAAEGPLAPGPAIRARALLWWVRLCNERPAPERDRELLVQRLGAGVELARRSGDPAVLLFALETAVLSVFVTGDMAGAARATAEGAALAAALGDEGAQRRFDYRVAMVMAAAGNPSGAAEVGASAFERARRARDVQSMVRSALLLIGLPAGTPGLPEPLPSLEALLGPAREAGALVEQGILLARLAQLRFDVGDLSAGATWTLRGLEFADRFGAWYASAYSIANLVVLAATRGDDVIAARLHGSLAQVMTEVMVGRTAAGATVYRAVVGQVRERLGPDAFDPAVGEGSLLRPEQALAVAMDYARTLEATTGEDAAAPSPRVVATRSVTDPPTAELTRRELEILRELATGATNRQIGDRLGLRPKTVMHHSVSIYGKLGVRSRTEATAWAYRERLLE